MNAKKKSEKSSAKKALQSALLSIIALVFIVGLGLYLLNNYLESYTQHGVQEEVEDYAGYHVSELNNLFSDNKLNYVIIDSVFVSSKEPGTVLSQNPIPGSFVKPERKIYLTINASQAPRVELPELRDFTLRQALSRIKTLNLEVDSIIYRVAVCSQCVIDVYAPDGSRLKANMKMEQGDQLVLVVGSGPTGERVKVPQLLGLSRNDAMQRLLDNGLNIGKESFDESVVSQEDTVSALVFMQYPQSDSVRTVEMGGIVDLSFTADSSKIESIYLDMNTNDSSDVSTQ